MEQELFTFSIGNVKCIFKSTALNCEDYFIDFDSPIYYNHDTKIHTKYIDYYSGAAFTHLLKENKKLKEILKNNGLDECTTCTNNGSDLCTHLCPIRDTED